MPAASTDAHLVARLDLGGTGPRVAVKDVIDIANTPTRAGSRAFAARPAATAHAFVVQRLLDAGCRIIGKANLHELAFGMTGINPWTGTPLNPRFPHLVPGGSSSGSATAVAAGLADWALGTDTGGSIRVPAACCGVAGLKPTFGRLSRTGLTPARSSLDCVGPLARTAAALQAAIAVLDPGFVPERQEGVPSIGLVACDALPAVAEAVASALRSSGATVVAATLPGMAAAFDAAMVVMNAEMFAAFGDLLAGEGLGEDIAARLRRAETIPVSAVQAAEAVRTAFAAEVDRALDAAGLDVLAMPTLPAFPVPLDAAGDAVAALGMSRLSRPFNLSGHPALTLPLPPVGGNPVGLQIVGRQGADARLCAVAEWLEARIVLPL